MIKKIHLILSFLLIVCTGHFLTADMKWSPPMTLANEPTLKNLQTAFNHMGQGVALWSDGSDSVDPTTLYYSFYENSRWSAPKTLFMADSFIFDFSVAMNDKGQILVGVHENIRGAPIGGSIAKVALFDTKKWGEFQTLSQAQDVYYEMLKVRLDNEGRGLAAWTYSDGTTLSSFLTACSYDGADWSRPQTISSNLSNDSAYDVSLSPQGKGVIAYANVDREVEARRYERGVWEPQATTISSKVFSISGKIITSHNDERGPAVVWTAQLPDHYSLQFTYFEEKWMPVSPVGRGFGGNQNNLQYDLSVNSKGDAIVAYGGSDKKLYSIHFQRGIPDLEIFLLSENFNPSNGTLCASLSDSNIGAVVWQEGTSTLKVSGCQSKKWDTNPSVLTDKLALSCGSIFVNNSNQALALWADNITADVNANLVCSFGKEQEMFMHPFAINLQVTKKLSKRHIGPSSNNLVWELKPNPNIKYFYVYRNNVLIAKLPAHQFEYSDFECLSSMVYRIEALDQNNCVVASGRSKVN